ncbi:head GIN domain-containing protein [Bergeyella sp. RCAD1439]|uniref:head GIN domain-containing protein n=1 Tax=Bergeyella anatis TaxID=3113737 RepID=UPI002E17E10D|nr:head GIN domain-containing protein [Bergeyella sp. RCAD1439]
MKTGVITVLAVWLLAACSSKEGKVTVRENFNTSESSASFTKGDREYTMDFEGIEVSTGIDAEVFRSEVEKVILEGDSEVLDKVEVKVEKGRLHIRFASGVNRVRRDRVKARIYARDIVFIEANSAADIVLKDKFVQEKMSVRASSAGEIEGALEANDLSIQASSSGVYKGDVWAVNLSVSTSSSGEVSLQGKAKNSQMEASSSGEIQSKNLVTEKALLQASSSGSIAVSVSGEAKASASSSGSVKVGRTQPNVPVQRDESSGGEVKIR